MTRFHWTRFHWAAPWADNPQVPTMATRGVVAMHARGWKALTSAVGPSSVVQRFPGLDNEQGPAPPSHPQMTQPIAICMETPVEKNGNGSILCLKFILTLHIL